MRSKFVGTPCFHIKDDTMIYRGTLGSPINPFKTLPGSQQDQPGSYSPTEPFYEVPKYGDEDPKSSSASSGSKYSSSGYVGSELWENDYFTVGPSPAHCYVNPSSASHPPVAVLSRTLQRSYGGSPQSSTSGMGSASGSSTVSNGSTRMFFSPAHQGSPRASNMSGPRGNTLMWMHGNPAQTSTNNQLVPMDKFSAASYRNDVMCNDDNFMDTRDTLLLPSIVNHQQQQQQLQQQQQQQYRTLSLFSSPNKKGEVRNLRSPKEGMNPNRQFRPIASNASNAYL